MRSIRSVVSLLCLLAVLISLAPPYAVVAQAQDAPPPVNPSVPSGQAPALLPAPQLTFTSGYAGQDIPVQGEAPADSSGVRIAWFYGGSTRSAAVTSVNELSRYQATIIVPFDAPVGPAQVCAAVTGSEAAEFACAGFTVIAAPPGEVVFVPPPELPLTPDDPAFVQLLDRAGAPLVELPLPTAETLRIPNVPVGIYDLAVVGGVGRPIAVEPVVVGAGAVVTAVFAVPNSLAIDPLTGQQCDTSRSIARASMTPSTKQATIPELANAGLAEFPAVAGAAPKYDFGVYVAGVPLLGSLEVQTQGSSTLGEARPRYVFVSNADPGKKVLEGYLEGANHLYRNNLDLGAKELTPGLWTLYIYPRTAVTEFCPATRVVRVVADPMKSTIFRGGGQSATTWNAAAQQYEFKGIAPNFLGLPLRYPDPAPDLPLLGPLKNELEAGLFVQGSIGLNHTMTFTALDAKSYALALNQSLFDKQFSIKPAWMKDVPYNPDDMRSLEVRTEKLSLVTKDWKTTVYKGVLASFWGVVTVNAAVNIGLHGELFLQATIFPLEPAVDITVTPYLEPWLAVSIWVDLLLGLASAGADATAGVGVALPFHVNTKDSRIVYFADPCVAVRAVLTAWARINLLFYQKTWNLGEWELLKYKSNGCGGYPDPKPPPPPPPPRILGTPAMVAGSNGTLAAAFIADAAQGNGSPIPKVTVLLREPGQTEWDYSKAMVLTDGSHMVQDPAITFAGSMIIVAWTETMLTAAEEQAAGDNMEQVLQRQEIRFAYARRDTNYRQWSAPASVTNDNVADGRPVLGGDSTDGATLAWVRSGGSSGYKRGSTDIAVVEYDQLANYSQVVWGERQIFDSGGMDAQPSVARYMPLNSNSWGWRALAFVSNADGDRTGKQRRIRLFYFDDKTAYANWKELDTSALPANPMSPSVSRDAHGFVWLSFLVGSETAPAAAVDPGAQLYMARWRTGQFVGLRQVLDWKTDCALGDPVFAEKPTMMVNESGYASVVFRRFGAAGTNGSLGQIALLSTKNWESGCRWQTPPVYLTNDRRPNWLPTAAIRRDTGDISLLWLQRSTTTAAAEFQAALARLAPASEAALPAAAIQTLTVEEDPLLGMTLANAPDPSLNPSLSFEPLQAAAGASVMVTATVRNLGLADANGVVVELYRGMPGAGVLVQSQAIAEPLPFGMPLPVTFNVAATDAPEPYYAVILAGPDGDTGSANNQATGVLNPLAQPQIVSVVQSPRFAGGVELSWSDDGNPALDGYRIVRATQPEGPYELIGTALDLHYVDLGVEQLVLYYYKVQSYDSGGARSAYSRPVTVLLPGEQIYLPIVAR